MADLPGGRIGDLYRPLTDKQLECIHGAALDIDAPVAEALAARPFISLICLIISPFKIYGMYGDIVCLMDQDLTVSYDKLVLDDDILGACMRVLKGIEVNDETLAIDLIEAAGPGGSFMAQEHTIRHMREEFSTPRCSDRGSYLQWTAEGTPDARERARRRLDAILANHEPQGVDEAVDRRLRGAFPEIRD